MVGGTYIGETYIGGNSWGSLGSLPENPIITPPPVTPPINTNPPLRGRAPIILALYPSNRYSTDIYDTSAPYDSNESYDGAGATQEVAGDRVFARIVY